MDQLETLSGIAAWDVDAEHENTRYFYRSEDVDEVISRQFLAITGQKGHGKTALAKRMEADNRGERCIRLSFRDFPFPSLYKLRNENESFHNRFTTAWIYVIVWAACNLIQRDSRYDEKAKEYFRKRFKFVTFSEKSIGTILDRAGSISFFGITIKLDGFERNQSLSRFSDIKRVSDRFLRDGLQRLARDRPYYIFFDELDEDYNRMLSDEEHKRNYQEMITGLLKAIERVRQLGDSVGSNLTPIMILRTDIYDRLHFNDKGKFERRVKDITWTREKIRKLLAYRISAIQATGALPAADEFWRSWGMIFDEADLNRSGVSSRAVFDFIAQRTFDRPRDYVSFLRLAAKHSIDRNSRLGISVEDVLEAEVGYSNYLRQEIVDAMGGIDVDLIQVVDCLANPAKRVLSYDELLAVVEQALSSNLRANGSARFYIEDLHYFSVVGPAAEGGQVNFKFSGQTRPLRQSDPVHIHPGLWRRFGLNGIDLADLSS